MLLKDHSQSKCIKNTATFTTCNHNLQFSQGRITWVSEENVDISHHALLLRYTRICPFLLIQNDEGALCEEKKKLFE